MKVLVLNTQMTCIMLKDNLLAELCIIYFSLISAYSFRLDTEFIMKITRNTMLTRQISLHDTTDCLISVHCLHSIPLTHYYC